MISRARMVMILVMIITVACNKVSYNKLDTTLENELLFFAQTEIPGEIESRDR